MKRSKSFVRGLDVGEETGGRERGSALMSRTGILCELSVFLC